MVAVPSPWEVSPVGILSYTGRGVIQAAINFNDELAALVIGSASSAQVRRVPNASRYCARLARGEKSNVASFKRLVGAGLQTFVT